MLGQGCQALMDSCLHGRLLGGAQFFYPLHMAQADLLLCAKSWKVAPIWRHSSLGLAGAQIAAILENLTLPPSGYTGV
jgi:hypothetical protein